MKKWMVAAWCASGLTLGCSGPCDDLQAVCNYCEDPNHKAACESSVDLDDSDRCDEDYDNYCIVCGRRGAMLIEECK